MKTVKIAKAGEVAGIAPPDVSIEFSGAPPEFEKNRDMPTAEFYKRANNWYEEQAAQLGSTLNVKADELLFIDNLSA